MEEEISKDAEYPWQPRIVDAKQHEFVDFSQEHLVFVVISTAGDGKCICRIMGIYVDIADRNYVPYTG